MTATSLPVPSTARPTPARLRAAAHAATRVALVRVSLVLLLFTVPARRLRRDDAGMSTAEYAVGTVAAVAFAAVLYKVVRSGAVQSALTAVINGALGTTL